MTIKLVIFLGLIAIALGSTIKPNRLTITSPKPSTTPKPTTVTNRVEIEWIEPKLIPVRRPRSPDSGSVGVNVNHNDKSGTSGSINANKNLWSSADGKSSLAGSASVSKNFDHGNSDKNIGLTFNQKF